jgi:hypothetical protein
MEKRTLLALIFGVLIFASCGGKKEEPSAQLISGSDSKTWKATKELNAQGDKEKLSKDEKGEELKFYSNGTFTMMGESEHQEGKWNYSPADKTLALTFNGADNSENFKVTEMDEDDMKLQAPDGSMMVLKAED